MKRRKDKLHHRTISLDDPLALSKEELKDDWSRNPLATLKNRELQNNLRQAIKKLPEKYKTVLILRDIDGHSNKEVGKILNITIPNVKQRVHRARLFLRQQLSSYFTNRGN